MGKLATEDVLREHQSQDPEAIGVLLLSHRALQNVSFLGEFKRLERLELSFNCLISLEALSSCINLKWLSVSQNKLQNLEGIENLSKLTVLNASRNNLKSMNEVTSLLSLRALILNDNKIGSICDLVRMKELNTIVLSRNPICKIGNCLRRVKSLKKISLSRCELEEIGSSLKHCTELRELRLSHNNIKSLPPELEHNKKLVNLDIGNNLIARWSGLKALRSLPNLRNLDIHGNLVDEKIKSAEKIQKLIGKLQIFNGRPLHRSKSDGNGTGHPTDHPPEESNRGGTAKLKKPKVISSENEDEVVETKMKKGTEQSKLEQGRPASIDDGETPFADLFSSVSEETSLKMEELAMPPLKKMKKTKHKNIVIELPASSCIEIGLGGPSKWDDH